MKKPTTITVCSFDQYRRNTGQTCDYYCLPANPGPDPNEAVRDEIILITGLPNGKKLVTIEGLPKKTKEDILVFLEGKLNRLKELKLSLAQEERWVMNLLRKRLKQCPPFPPQASSY